MTPERAETIYEELEKLVVVLDPDPASRGTAYMQDQISKTRGYLNRTLNFRQEVNRQKQGLERELHGLEAAYEISSSDLLAGDNRVTRLPNIDDRKAMISLLLKEDRRKILDLKGQIKDLGFVEKAVMMVHKELDNTMSAIRMQKSLIDTDLRTGSYYGDESDTARGPKNFAASDIDEEELANLLSDVMSEPALVEAAVTAQPAQSSQPDLEEEAPQLVVGSALQEPNSELTSIEKFLEGDDYADIFSELSNS